METVEDKINSLYGGQSSMLIMLIAESGRGKSASLRNMDPSETYLINVVGKPLPFQRGVAYKKGENMLISCEARDIIAKMKEVSKDDRIKNIVVDDAQYIMANEFVRRAMEKGYDKFSIMAKNMWDVLTTATTLREGLKVFFLMHEEETTSGRRKMKTIGRMLDEKLTPEGLATIVFYGDLIFQKDKPNQYVFVTQSDGTTNAKSPMGMFPRLIPNDLNLVSRRIDEYYSGVELDKSKLDLAIA